MTAVLLFHLGHGDYGYLGVDVFFVISGFFITGVIVRDLSSGEFSFTRFFGARIRRLMPLSLLVTATTLFVGYFLMLPDDFENLAQSAVATNLFSNNILQTITTGNYWDVVNEFKPLLHTWSLGLEEQFYLFFPAALWLLYRAGARRAAYLLIPIFLGSFALNLGDFSHEYEFYLLPFRMFELALGGLVATTITKPILRGAWGLIPLSILLLVLAFRAPGLSPFGQLLLALSCTALIIASDYGGSPITRMLYTNRLVSFVGLASYGIYLWHQPIIAFARYAYLETLSPGMEIILVALIGLLSAATYRFVENPFRSAAFSARRLGAWVVPAYVATTLAALYFYSVGGVVRNVPELEVTRAEGAPGMHAVYNSRPHEHSAPFTNGKDLKILVVGNSFARDWVNVLLESRFAEGMEISYWPAGAESARPFAQKADFAFVHLEQVEDPEAVAEDLGVPATRVFAIGTKNFGASSGIYYNRPAPQRWQQTARVATETLVLNEQLGAVWRAQYIDFLAALSVENGRVPVFTPEGKFFSQDTRHLTRAGAQRFAELLEPRLEEIFASSSEGPVGALRAG